MGAAKTAMQQKEVVQQANLEEAQAKLGPEKEKINAVEANNNLLQTEKRQAKEGADRVEGKLDTQKAQYAAASGELTSKLDMTQKNLNRETDTISVLKESNAKLRGDNRRARDKLESTTLKYRESTATTGNLESQLEQMKHELTAEKAKTEKLRETLSRTESGKELAEGRLSMLIRSMY